MAQKRHTDEDILRLLREIDLFLTQPIRVPGSIHGKHGIQTPVRILVASGYEYDLDDLLERAKEAPRLPSLPPRDDFGGVQKPRTPVVDLIKEKVRAGAKVETTRFAALSRVIGHWLRLVRFNQATIEGGPVRSAGLQPGPDRPGLA